VERADLVGWGAAVVGQIYSLIRPYVISARVQLHTLLVFFALLAACELSASWVFSSDLSFSESPL